MKIAIAILAACVLLSLPARAEHEHHDNGHHYGSGHYSGVPGPIAGAGLPLLGIGFGFYWLARRWRRS